MSNQNTQSVEQNTQSVEQKVDEYLKVKQGYIDLKNIKEFDNKYKNLDVL